MNTALRETGSGGRPAPGGKAGGYSLVELMSALGILAITLPMIGTAFLAGMVENREAVESTMSTLVAENALSVVRARVGHSQLVLEWDKNSMSNPARIPTSLVNQDDLAWVPFQRSGANEVGDGEEKWIFGCVVAAQRMADDTNDYLLVAIPFKKFSESDTIQEVDVKTDTATGKVTKYMVKLSSASESAALSYLAVRTSLKP